MTERIRILMLNKLRWPWVGGVERVAEQIFERLPERYPVSMTYVYISQTDCFQDQKISEHQRAIELPNFFYTWFRRTLIGRMPWSFRLFAWVRRQACEHDAMLLHWPFPLGLLAWLWAGVGVRRAMPLHVFWHSDVRRYPLIMFFLGPLLRYMLKKSAGIIVTSPQMLQYSPWLQAYAAKTHVVPLGVPLGRFKNPVVPVPDHLPDKFFLCVGRLAAYKGYDVLLNALKGQSWPVLIVGQGPLEQELKTLATQMGISSLRWLGECSDEEIVGLMQRCYALLLPSVDEAEAYGIVQIEAMACGKPVISSDLKSGVPFVNAHNVSGLIVPPRDAQALSTAMGCLWNDAALYQRLSQAAAQRAQAEFSEEKMLERLAEVLLSPHYSDLLAAGSRV